MKVWIIECDHEPMTGVAHFPDDHLGRKTVIAFLNHLPTDGERHYYDAVLYELVGPK